MAAGSPWHLSRPTTRCGVADVVWWSHFRRELSGNTGDDAHRAAMATNRGTTVSADRRGRIAVKARGHESVVTDHGAPGAGPDQTWAGRGWRPRPGHLACYEFFRRDDFSSVTSCGARL